MGRRKLVALTKEQSQLSPFGKPNCPLCSLSPDDLTYIHELKYTKGWKYTKILDYVRHYNKISPSYSKLCDHFRKHTNEGAQKKLTQKNKVKPEVAVVLQDLPSHTKLTTNKDVEDAYSQLVKMSSSFTQRLDKLFGIIDLNDATLKKAKDQLEGMDILDALEKLGKLHKEAREQIKDISSLRAPKVMVAQFLEGAINEVIRETGYILSDLCGFLQGTLIDELKLADLDDGSINGQTFAKVFKDAALQYKNRMISLSREQMMKAMAALADLEKII